jgi:hypothetical protein
MLKKYDAQVRREYYYIFIFNIFQTLIALYMQGTEIRTPVILLIYLNDGIYSH